MNHHDVGRGRGGVKEALGAITSSVTVISIESDRLYPPKLQEELVDLIPNARPLQSVKSNVGHDGFLLETAQISKLIETSLNC